MKINIVTATNMRNYCLLKSKKFSAKTMKRYIVSILPQKCVAYKIK